MALYLSVPRSTSVFYSGSYIDVLAASHPTDTSDAYDTTHYDIGALPDEL